MTRQWGDDPAPAVLFWHGLAPSATGLDALPLARALGPQVRLVAPDAPGFGGSPPLPPERYRGGALAELVLALLDALALDRVAFVGASWGAWVGCHVAAADAGRVSALVLLDGGYTEAGDWPGARAREFRLQDCVELGRRRGVPSPETWGAALHATLTPPPVSATYASLAEAGIPVLLLAAEDGDEATRCASERGLERFRRALPRADVRVLAGVGHDVLASPSALRMTVEWLRRYAGSA